MSWLRRRTHGGLTRELINLALLLALTGVVVATVRPTLFSLDERIAEKHDVYFLPPPDQVVTMSLGYRAAVADALWAHVLVAQGLRSIERRRFENLHRLYDVINTLAPTWRTPYLYVDAIFSFQAKGDRYEDAKLARAILERGVENRPFDAELWLNLGSYVAYIAAPSYVFPHDREEYEQWRLDGARALARAAELAAGDPNSRIGWLSMGASRILREAGEREANLRFMRRALAVADDEELKEYLRERIAVLAGEEQLADFQRREKAFRDAVEGYLPFVSRDTAMVLGPPPAPARCAGLGHEDEPACAHTWREWAERMDRQAPAER